MKKLLILLVPLLLPFLILAQIDGNKVKTGKNYVSSDYNRNSITIVGLDFSENLSSKVLAKFSELEVPEKFYNNPLQNNIIKPDVDRQSVSNMLQQLDVDAVADWLNKNKVGQQILAKWFNQQPDGSFNVDVLKERGLFNANDNEYIMASASKRGEASLMDMGLDLVNKSYVMVFDFPNILTMNQFYDKNEIEADKRNMNGYKSDLKGYLYKLNFNDSAAAVFFQNYWAGANDPNKTAKIEAFNNADFEFIPIAKQYGTLASTQYNAGHSLAPKKQKSSDELLEQLVQGAMTKIINDVERQDEAFRVKAMISDVKPISAKIGKKEGLGFDQRYFVYENRQRRNGTLYSKRIGVVKSMKVADNKYVTSGQTDKSEFYQIAGGKVDNYGMFLEQHNDAGVNLFVGTTVGGLPGATGRLELYISKFMGELASPDKSAKGLTSLKLYVEGGIGSDDYFVDDYLEDFNFSHFSVGINKDFYPLNFLHWGPFIGYGMESATWESSDNKISTDFIELGARMGINLAHNIQLIGSLNYYMMLTSQVLDENKEVINEDFDYKSVFDDRFGPGVSIGLRIMF